MSLFSEVFVLFLCLSCFSLKTPQSSPPPCFFGKTGPLGKTPFFSGFTHDPPPLSYFLLFEEGASPPVFSPPVLPPLRTNGFEAQLFGRGFPPSRKFFSGIEIFFSPFHQDLIRASYPSLLSPWMAAGSSVKGVEIPFFALAWILLVLSGSLIFPF